MDTQTTPHQSTNSSLADIAVGALVAERPGRSRIFQAHKIDFCCQGDRTVREACERRGVALEEILSALEAEMSESIEEGFNPAELPPGELADYIVEKHHGYLRRELPRLQAMAQRVARVHGERTPSLVEVERVFEGLQEEIQSHLLKEEEILFPAVRALVAGGALPMSLDGPIDCMIHEHEDAGEALRQLHDLTGGYVPPADACNTYRALFAGLSDLEKDLHRHIHLENSVLFPAAERLCTEAATR